MNSCHHWAKWGNSLTKTTLSLFSYWICSSQMIIDQVILSTHYNWAHSDRTSEPPSIMPHSTTCLENEVTKQEAPDHTSHVVEWACGKQNVANNSGVLCVQIEMHWSIHAWCLSNSASWSSACLGTWNVIHQWLLVYSLHQRDLTEPRQNLKDLTAAHNSIILYIYKYMKSSFAKTDNSVFNNFQNQVFHCAFQLISIKLQLGYFD